MAVHYITPESAKEFWGISDKEFRAMVKSGLLELTQQGTVKADLDVWERRKRSQERTGASKLGKYVHKRGKWRKVQIINYIWVHETPEGGGGNTYPDGDTKTFPSLEEALLDAQRDRRFVRNPVRREYDPKERYMRTLEPSERQFKGLYLGFRELSALRDLLISMGDNVPIELLRVKRRLSEWDGTKFQNTRTYYGIYSKTNVNNSGVEHTARGLAPKPAQDK